MDKQVKHEVMQQVKSREIGHYYAPSHDLEFSVSTDGATASVSDHDCPDKYTFVSLEDGDRDTITIAEGKTNDELLAQIDSALAVLQAARSWIAEHRGKVTRTCEKCGAPARYQAKTEGRWTDWCGCGGTEDDLCAKADGGVHVVSDRTGNSCVFCNKEI